MTITKSQQVFKNSYVKEMGLNNKVGAHLFTRSINNAQALTENYKNDTDILDLSAAIDNIMGSLAKFGYFPGSEIGTIISITCVCYVLKDKELNKQFLNKDGNVDIFKLGAIFPKVGTKGNLCGYESIFSEKEYIQVTDKTKRTHKALLACKEKLMPLQSRIEHFNGGNADDLVRLGKDLEIYSTVISELEIDAAKDDSKREGMLSIDDFMNTKLSQRSRKISFTNNFQDMINYKKGYSASATSELEFEPVKVTTMFEFDEVYASKEKAFIEDLKASGEYSVISDENLQKELRKLKYQVRNDCMIVDPLFEVIETMHETVKDTLKGFGACYMNSDMNLFKGLSILPQRNEEDNWMEHESLEEAIYAVKKVAVIVYDMINNTFSYNKFMSMTDVKDLAKIGRDLIYNAGAVRGFTPHDTFLMGVDAGWYKRNSKGNIVNTADPSNISTKENFKYAAVEAVFGTELKHYFNPEAMRKVAELEIPNEIMCAGIFAPNVVLGFKDGQCTIPVGDEEYTILRVDDVEYNGNLMLVVDNEGCAEFVENNNQYAYNVIDYVVFDSIADVTSKANSITPEDFEALLLSVESEKYAMANRYKHSKLTLKTKSEKTNSYFLTDEEKVREGQRVGSLVEYWSNMIKLEYVHGLNSRIEQKHYCLSDATGKGRILGSVHDSFLEADKEYNDIITIATPVGAIMIKSVK